MEVSDRGREGESERERGMERERDFAKKIM